jgi:DNA-binding transcriptional MocR family regulator
MTGSIAAARLATLARDFDRTPAYAGLADELRLLIGDGRVDADLRLPSERDLSAALGVSRTTVTRAYASLVESGYAVARQGSGTYTRVPGGRRHALDRTLTPGLRDDDMVDLSCAAPSAPPGIAAAYVDAVQDLPLYLGGHGYFPTGVPALQEAVAATYEDRGLRTDPAQILVVPGALSGLMIVAQALVGAGDRVLVESPGYPNAQAALGHAGARRVAVPMDVDGWDLDAVGRIANQARPRLAYLIPDFQNPTGNLMGDDQREQYAAMLGRTGSVPVVDESHAHLDLDNGPMPRPFATFAPDTISLGSASKCLWGGLRVGWIRSPLALVERLVAARVALDLGSPVYEQLVTSRLLDRRDEHWAANRSRLRVQRAVLAEALARRLPDWRFRLPSGGLAFWCELPTGGRRGGAVALAADAERRGVAVSPGPVFGADGGFDSFVRIPYTRPVHELRDAVDRLAEAWGTVSDSPTRGPERRTRVMVA